MRISPKRRGAQTNNELGLWIIPLQPFQGVRPIAVDGGRFSATEPRARGPAKLVEQQSIVGPAPVDRFIVKKMYFLHLGHLNVRAQAQVCVERRRAALLNTDDEKIDYRRCRGWIGRDHRSPMKIAWSLLAREPWAQRRPMSN